MSAPAAEELAVTRFEVGEVSYAVPGRVVRLLPAPTPLPVEVKHDGHGFGFVDLRPPAAEREDDPEGAWLALVEDGAERAALLVDRLNGLDRLRWDEMQPVPAAYPESERRRWRGLWPLPDGRVVVCLELAGFAPAEGSPDGGPDGGEG